MATEARWIITMSATTGKKKIAKCCFCQRSIDTTNKGVGDDFVLLSCKCFSCPKCIIQHSINRKTDPVKCRNTEHNNGTSIDELKYFFSSRTNSGVNMSINVDNDEATIENDPVTFFTKEFSKNEKEMVSKMFLSLTYVRENHTKGKNDAYKIRTVLSILDSQYGLESEKDKDQLRIIFGLLHDPIITQHKVESKGYSAIPRMTAALFCEYGIEKDNTTLLKLLYAISTGDICFSREEFTGNDRNAPTRLSNFLAVCVAKGMIERVSSNVPGPLQLMISDMMSLVNAPRLIKDFLAKIRLATGSRTTDRANQKNEIISLRRRLVLKPRQTLRLSFDNFSFDGMGGKHAQHTIIQIMVITEKQLRGVGFYNNNGPKISRVRKSIEEVLVEEHDSDEVELAISIVVPNLNDYKELSRRIFQTIKTVVCLELPSVDECREMIEATDVIAWPHLLPSNLGVRVETVKEKARSNKVEMSSCSLDLFKEDPESEDNDRNTSKDNVHNIDKNSKRLWKDLPISYYKMNNIHLDHVMHADPGSNMAIEQIIGYMEKSTNMSDEDIEDCNRTTGEDPVRTIIAAGTADGAPAKGWLNFQALDVEKAKGVFDDRKFKRARVYFGGLHFMMEFLSKRGDLCQDLTAYFARKWRPTEKGLKWIMGEIRDPKDGLTEWREYLMAHYKAASESAGSNNVQEIHNYMLKRAIEKPMCQGLLFDLRLLEIFFAIRDSEKAGNHGDVPLFLTCLRFSLPLFAITHAINYCHLVCDFLEWYKLTSDAERILFNNFFYTTLSVNSKPIWVDRGVEWTVGHIRKFMGRRIRQHNHDEAIERLVSDLPFRMEGKKDLEGLLNLNKEESYSSMDWNDQKFQIGSAFLHTRVALSDTNIWGPGNLKGDLRCENDSISIVMGDKDNNKDHVISSTLMNGYELGIDRIISYFVENHCNNRYKKTRSETRGVTLKKLPTTHDRRMKEIHKTRVERYSCDYTAILKHRNFIISDIKGDLEFYRKHVDDIPPTSILNTYKRPELVEALCKYRREYFTKFPAEKQALIDSVDELEKMEGISTEGNRRNQVQNSLLYRLDEDVLNEFD